jgi:peptidoglycan/LPS O-acetylase OafA/YrhL
MAGKKKPADHYIPGLDGLRAFAVIAVVAYHLFPTALPGGFIGVDIFFVISGFLITSLLIREHSKNGKVDLKRFWTRRARRLLPALFVVVGVSSSAALLIKGDVLVGLSRQILGAVTFNNNWIEIASGTNYFDAASLHLFANFWSLAVEEQFYVVWPFIIVGILGISTLTKRYRVGLWASLVLSLASASLMIFVFNGENITRVYYGSDTHAFGLMLGAAIAFVGNVRYAKAVQRQDKWPSARFKRPKIIQTAGILSLVGITALACFMSEQSLAYRGALFAASILTGIVIVAVVSKRGLLQRLFEARPLKWVGVRSYGIYLWHWPVFVLFHYALPGNYQWITPIATIAATFAAAALSYRYLEMPVRAVGIRKSIVRGFKRDTATASDASKSRQLRVHPFAVASIALVVVTAAAITAAPTKTKAEQQVEAGQAAIAKQQSASAAAVSKKPKHITGKDITLVGDSVSLASAPELQAKFPGIYINAEVSRSMRRGGLETIENLLAAKQMRSVLVIALGTNGYYGDGFIPRLLKEVGSDREVIFVTSHAPVAWVRDNNNYLHTIAKQYHNVYIAEWDAAITAHIEDLGPDSIHPGPTGGGLYANSIAAAIAKIR